MRSSLYPILQKCKRIILVIIYDFYKLIFKCDEKKIVIASNTKKELYGNLLYIYDELKNYDYNVKVLLINRANFLEKQKFYFEFLYNIATAKYILIDDFFPIMYPLKMRKGTKFIQVWHALGAFKKVGHSRSDIGNKNSITHKNYTDTIVSSKAIVKNYAEAFGIDESRVHPLGIPRTDMFFEPKKIEDKKIKIYEEFEFFKGKRIILFAPTFRGNGRKYAYYPEEYIDLDDIYINLLENDVFIIKMHPFIKNKIQIKEEYKDKIIDLTDYNDINNLLLITDLLITDYSSVIFEYSFMEKPIIFYVPDLEEYDETRSFYYDYDEYMYGVLARDKKGLIESIKNPVVDKIKLKKFRTKFLSSCDGKSTKRFVNELILK